MDTSGTDCAIARESVSADLDGELHELDSRRLQAHLRVCAGCSAWAEFVQDATARLREAPLEEPAALELLRRRAWRFSPARAVAPAVALLASLAVALSGASHGSLRGNQRTSTPRSSMRRDLGPTSHVHVPATQHAALRAI